MPGFENKFKTNETLAKPVTKNQNRRLTLHFMKTIPLLITCLVISCVQSFADVPQKPNIVIIVADDLGYADVMFNPQHPKEVTTPHLDALAKESLICRQGYVTCHVCSPSRTGLLTGRYQQRLGLYTAGEAGSGVPMSVELFPQYLKPYGYVTCQLGKWHLVPDLAWSPALRGFDEVFGFLGRGAHDYFKLNDPDDPIYRGTNVVHENGYLTDRLGEEAVSFISRHKSQPFFLYLAFNAVHAPLEAPADEIAKFKTDNNDRNTLLAMGKRMDDAIGNVIAQLKHDGVWENTLLFFISDNGGPLPQSAVNTPLRAGKHTDYEGGIRVPFLVCWPGKLQPGESQAVVSSLDFLPTVLAVTGAAGPTNQPLDGMNIMPALRGEAAAPSRNLFWTSGSEEGWWAVRSGDWKLVGEKAKLGLFDLSKDVSETNDLAKQMPEKVAELTKLHDVWLAEMANPIKGEGKRYGMAESSDSKPKKAKGDKKTKGGKKEKPAAAAPEEKDSATAPAAVKNSFAALPSKPWKAARGNWEAKDGALWASQKEGEDQEAMLRGPAVFDGGSLACEFNLAAGSHFTLRFKSASGTNIFRADITPAAMTVTKLVGASNEALKNLPLKLTLGTWHKLTLKFDGPELYATVDGAPLPVADSVFESEKSEVAFLVSGGVVGFRNYSLTPFGSAGATVN
jgi:arylsulfatase A-like enzyme